MTGAPTATFRDPDGSLLLEGDQAVRTLRPGAREAALQFVASPFYQRVRQRGDMVSTTIDDSEVGLRLLHPRIPVPSYPWEWTPSQWFAAAELTLGLCQEAIQDGWILKDATPLNILFVGPRPVLVDVLSFDRRDPASSIWLAYGQYVRTFLLPLLMNQTARWPLALSLFRRDGYEPAELYAAMRWTQRLSRGALWPVTLPALLERPRKHSASTGPKRAAPARSPEVATHILTRTLEGLRGRTRRAVASSPGSDWSDYTATLTHYTPEQSQDKRAWMQQLLAELRPASVLDIGANTGEYSALTAETGADVVALERDAASAEQIFRMSRARNLPIQTLHADFARPTPAAGWENSESSALLPRLESRFDLVLMLAVIHHLLLLEQIPLSLILALCHRLTQRHLVVEWVPPSDPMYQDLMRGRDDLYSTLSEADLLSACAGLFTVARQHTLGNGRTLFLLEKNA